MLVATTIDAFGVVAPRSSVVHLGSTTLSWSTSSSSSSSSLSALSERQMQFWEDVEAGLDDIENFYLKKGQSIDRIRQFGMRFVENDDIASPDDNESHNFLHVMHCTLF
jgi:hypothetical protein